MSRPTARPLRRVGRAALVLGLLTALWVVPGASGADLDPTDPSAPGLADPIPFTRCEVSTLNNPPGFQPPTGLPAEQLCNIVRNPGTDDFVNSPTFSGVATLGLQGAPHLKQWIKVPLARAVSSISLHVLSLESQPPSEIPDLGNLFYLYSGVYFLSADQKRVGEIPPFRVTTMAFGTVPVQVTIHATQPRRADGSVESISLRTANPTKRFDSTAPLGGVMRDSHGTGRLLVRLSDLEVDGHPVDLGTRCQTRTPGTLTLYGEGYQIPATDPPDAPVPPGKYNPRAGGTLHGSLDIPAFAHCGVGGEDLSPLLTNGVSGADNPLTVVQGPANDACYPLDAPYTENPSRTTRCQVPQPLTVPTTDAQPQTPLPSPPYPIPRQ